MDPKTLASWWKPRPVLGPELTAALEDLHRLETKRPDLASVAQGLRPLLIAGFADLEAVSSEIPQAQDYPWSQGQPFYQVHPPRLDPTQLKARLRRVAEAADLSGEPARKLARCVATRAFDPTTWTDAILSGDVERFASDCENRGLDPERAGSILRLTLLALLGPRSSAIDRVRPDNAWDRGDCSLCGSRPILLESRGLEQRLFLRCGLCGSGWPGARLGCPACGESSPKRVHHSFVEGEQDQYRLGHCEACQDDWKVVSTLTPLSNVGMIVADLATVHLDFLARGGRDQTP